MSLWQVWGKYHSLPSNDRPLDVSWYQASHQLIPADTWFNPHLCSECRHFGHTSRSRYLLTLNSLPPAVFNSISLSLSTFKSRLKTHLFSTTQPACSAGTSVADVTFCNRMKCTYAKQHDIHTTICWWSRGRTHLKWNTAGSVKVWTGSSRDFSRRLSQAIRSHARRAYRQLHRITSVRSTEYNSINLDN